MELRCLGKACKYFRDDCPDGPGYCGLISKLNRLLEIAELPKMEYVLWHNNDFVFCPFSKWDILKINELDYCFVVDLNKAIDEQFLITPSCYEETVISRKKGGSK